MPIVISQMIHCPLVVVNSPKLKHIVLARCREIGIPKISAEDGVRVTGDQVLHLVSSFVHNFYIVAIRNEYEVVRWHSYTLWFLIIVSFNLCFRILDINYFVVEAHDHSLLLQGQTVVLGKEAQHWDVLLYGQY